MSLIPFFQRRNESEFKPDATSATWLKTVRMTRQQRLRLTKWLTYVLSLILAVVLQDVLLSQIRLFGAAPELVVSMILLITVMEGSEVGSLFVLIASVLYFYTGTAPGAYTIGLLCFLGIGVTLTRQMYLNRNKASMVLCAGGAAFVYEICIFAVGIFSELTRWERFGSFLMAGIYNFLLMIPLYPLIFKIGQIGGNTWKE